MQETGGMNVLWQLWDKGIKREWGGEATNSREGITEQSRAALALPDMLLRDTFSLRVL